MSQLINGWRTFVLTIRRNADKAKETMRLLGEAGIQAEPFHGLDAQVTGVNGTQWTYEVDYPGSNHHISEKKINMMLSYLMLWKTMSYLPDDAFLILEDDVRFDADWKRHWDEAMTHLPDDWDLIYLGNCCCQGRSDQDVIWGRLHRVKYALCTHAFAVRKKALGLLLEKCEKIWATIDIAIALECMPHLNCYAMLPRIADQVDMKLVP